MNSTPLTILSTEIRRDAQGRFSLNDCHRASGGEKKNGPSYWMATKEAEKLIDKLAQETAVIPVVVVEGRNGGTFVARELVYAFAMWISAEFSLTVIRAFDALVSGKATLNANPLSREQQLANAVLLSQDIIREKDEKIAALAPKAESFDELANQNGRHNLRSAAQQSGWPEKLFIARAVTEGWLYIHSVTGKKLAYADKIKAGLMDVKNVSIQRSSGFSENVGQPLFTQKGLLKFRELIGPYRP